MANPQAEDGAIKIAYDLYLALLQYDFSGLELRIVMAVMFLSYGAGKKKAQMTTEDIRYIMGASDKLRTDRINAALGRLFERNILFRQELVNGEQILGIQKDYELWLTNDKVSGLNVLSVNTNSKNKTYEVRSDKMSVLAPAPDRLVQYAMEKGHFKHSLPSYKAELKQAKRLYQEVIGKTHSGSEAFNYICDYINDDEWMRSNVKMQFTYMSTWFPKWFAQIPPKPAQVTRDERESGFRHRYDVKGKQWRRTNDRI